jgi:hypothetical protein
VLGATVNRESSTGNKKHLPYLERRRGEEGMSRERRTQIIAIRVPPAAKRRFLEEAQKREETLTNFIWELIGAGWNIVVKQNMNESVKQ